MVFLEASAAESDFQFLTIKDKVYGEVIILQAESMQKTFCDSSTPRNYVAIWKIRDSKRDKELQ